MFDLCADHVQHTSTTPRRLTFWLRSLEFWPALSIPPARSVVFCAMAQTQQQEGGGVLVLDSISLDVALQTGAPLMVDFYAPW